MILDFSDVTIGIEDEWSDFSFGIHSKKEIANIDKADFLIRFFNAIVKVEKGSCKKLNNTTYIVKGMSWKKATVHEARKIKIDDLL